MTKGPAFVTDKSFRTMMYFSSSVKSYRWSVARYRQYCTAIGDDFINIHKKYAQILKYSLPSPPYSTAS